jgi:predicted benzoate:H+ symporter BenE
LPWSTYVALALAAPFLCTITQLALFGIGGAALGLLLLGIHNAWDTVTYIVVGGACDDTPKRE